MKKKTIILAVSSVALLAVLMPFLIKGVKAAEADRKLTKEYESYVASTDTFFDNTFLNGVDISGKSVDEASSVVVDSFENAGSIEVRSPYDEDGETYSFKGLEVSKEGVKAYLEERFKERSLSKGEYIHGAKQKLYTYDFSDDIDFSKSDFSSLELFDESKQVKSEDAYVEVDEKRNTRIVAEVVGTCIDRKCFEKKLKEAVKNGASEVSLDYDDFIMPNVLSTDESLEVDKEYIDMLLTKTILFNVCGVELLLNPDDTFKLYDFEKDDYVDEDALSAYIDGLKKNYDTYGSYRPFTTSLGTNVTIMGGDFGWLINKADTMKALEEALLSKTQNASAIAAYDVVGQRPAGSEIGNTYVEISLEHQKIWMYLNGEQIVYDDCTTGEATDPNCTSDAGMFRLVVKKQDVVLRGPTWEDFVSFWMNFDGNNGMHDASWRTDEEFGGTNRYGNGSHGCTNLRYNTASTVYNNIQYDTPIIVW